MDLCGLVVIKDWTGNCWFCGLLHKTSCKASLQIGISELSPAISNQKLCKLKISHEEGTDLQL